MSGVCRPISKHMLKDPIEVHWDVERPRLSLARQVADEAARARDIDPMLLSWFEASSGHHSPRVECCRDDKPGWLAYAQSRGGDLVISINNLSYVFVYLRSSSLDAPLGAQS
jgi:hypothetical protein